MFQPHHSAFRSCSLYLQQCPVSSRSLAYLGPDINCKKIPPRKNDDHSRALRKVYVADMLEHMLAATLKLLLTSIAALRGNRARDQAMTFRSRNTLFHSKNSTRLVTVLLFLRFFTWAPLLLAASRITSPRR